MAEYTSSLGWGAGEGSLNGMLGLGLGGALDA